jgi:hypothetical protein
MTIHKKICALLGLTWCRGNPLPTFWDKVSVPKHGQRITISCHVIPQKSADLRLLLGQQLAQWAMLK